MTPACPHCGCNAAELVGAGMRWGRAWALFECDHCGKQYSLGQRPANTTNGHQYRVPYERTKCPSCSGTNTRVTATPAKKSAAEMQIRYHGCDDCGCKFSSFEPSELG